MRAVANPRAVFAPAVHSLFCESQPQRYCDTQRSMQPLRTRASGPQGRKPQGRLGLLLNSTSALLRAVLPSERDGGEEVCD